MKSITLVLTYLTMAIIMALSLAGTAHAADGHITLLTVSDDVRGIGGTADLYLRIEPGNGAIYIDSFPLTKVDTQSSIRYANQIACDLLQEDCSQYDFFYTIRANSAIVGGPSAGAAITVLTVAVLDGEELDQRTAMTGTINSGGIVGPVAGVNAKVRGAKAAGITKVLIPALTSNPEIMGVTANETLSDDENSTLNETEIPAPPVKQEPLLQGRVEELSDHRTAVIRVGTVEDALYEFTGKSYAQELAPVAAPQEYKERMAQIAAEICNRTDALELQVQERGLAYNDTNNYTAAIQNLTADHYYSRASLCFSKNIILANTLLGNTSAEERDALYERLKEKERELDNRTAEASIETITDLETYAIVKERIIEAQTILNGEEARTPGNLAYAQERLVSAESWSRFFGMPGTPLPLNQQYLQRACLAKLGEAEERINYVRIYAPRIVAESEQMLGQAQLYSGTEPILCIFTASKAKAQANVLADALSIGQENVDALVQQKLSADAAILAKQQQKSFFPILGYSYAQYAEDLRGRMPYSALIFSEYALELSNLDMYFPKEQSFRLPAGLPDAAILFGLGGIFGAAIAVFILGRRIVQSGATAPRNVQATRGTAMRSRPAPAARQARPVKRTIGRKGRR